MFYKFNLKADKIISLLNDEMIDDIIINNFFDFLNNISFNTYNKQFFYLRFFPWLKNKNFSGAFGYVTSSRLIKNQYLYKNNYTKIKDTVFRMGITEYDEIFIPIHDGVLHWTLAYFNLKERKCYHYDSLGSTSKVILKIIGTCFLKIFRVME